MQIVINSDIKKEEKSVNTLVNHWFKKKSSKKEIPNLNLRIHFGNIRREKNQSLCKFSFDLFLWYTVNRLARKNEKPDMVNIYHKKIKCTVHARIA